jgi:hypothetical protein
MGWIINRISIVIACVFLCIAATGADEYVGGEVVVKCLDVLTLFNEEGIPQTGDEELDDLIIELGVYDISEIYDYLPTEPIEDPNGKWDWQDWQNMMAVYRFDT